MIAVWKSNDDIRIVTTTELIDVFTIKEIVKTIKRITNNNNSPNKVLLKPINQVNFTHRGELFFKKITTTKRLHNLKISISHEVS